MRESKRLVNGIVAVVLIAFGLVLGVNWGSARFCLGDRIFLALGLPAWSNGTSGMHYPAIVGACFLFAGISVFDSVLHGKTRAWIRTIAAMVLAGVYFVFAFV